MLQKSNRKVYSKVAAELVDFALDHVPMTKECANACWQNLVEVMTNTHNHAQVHGQRTRREQRLLQPWFASVYCRERTAYFNFVDLGVGILRSAQTRHFLRKLQATASAYGRSRLLRDTFEGRIGSVTGKPGRGLGLPKMRQDAKNDRLPDLQILTADVVGSVAELDFRSTGESLQGTAFRWCVSDQGVAP